MAHLAGEVEDHLAVAHEVVHRAFLPDVGDVHADAVGDAVDVEEICARIRDQRIHQQHVGAELDETAGDVAADEAEAAGDHHAPAAIEILIRRVTEHPLSSALRRGAVSAAPATSMRASHDERDPELHHVDARAVDAGEIEELRLAVRPMVVVNRHLDNPEAGVLDLLHHLQADDAAVLLELHAVENRSAHHPEVAVDVADVQAEQHLDDVVIDRAR